MKTLLRLSEKPDVPSALAWYLTELAEYRGKQELFTRQSPEKLKVLREHAIVESAVSSNRIEGVEIERGRVDAVVLGESSLRDRNEEEIRGYRDALKLIHDKHRELVLDERTIRELHLLCRGELWDAGQYKERDGDIIGPGMAIYSRYSRILEGSGKSISVRTALSLINQTLTEVLSEHEDEFDADTRWAIAWFDLQGFGEGDFGEAEVLSKAKVTSVAGLQQAGVIRSKGGKVRLLRPEELPSDWDPATDKRLTIWEMTNHLLRIYFHAKAGDEATAALLRKLGSRGEIARALAYRLFDVCEKKKRSQDAQEYNALVLGWPEVARLAREGSKPRAEQDALFGDTEGRSDS